MTTSGTAPCGNAVGIDVELRGVLAQITHGGFAIFNAVEWRGVVSGVNAVFDGCGKHALFGKVLAMWKKLLGIATDPAPAKKEDDGGCWRLGFGGFKNVDVEVALWGGFVGDLFGGLHGFLGKLVLWIFR